MDPRLWFPIVSVLFLLVGQAEPEIIKEIGLKTTFTDNLNASIEQMQEPLETVVEATFVGRLGLGYKGKYGKRSFFYGIYRADATIHKESERLRFFNHTLFLQTNNNLSKLTSVNVSGIFRYYDYYNLDVLTNTQTQIDIYLKHYLKMETVLEANYNFSLNRFENVGFESPTDLTNMTFNLVNRQTHAGRIKLKRWVSKWFRTSVEGAVGFSRYDHSASGFLFRLTGLGRDDNRQDLYWNVKPAVTVVKGQAWLISLGYLFEKNNSNSFYYDFNANGAVLDVFYSPQAKHKIFYIGKYGLYDFFDRQNDSRFADTKKDHRFYATLGYTFNVTDHIAFLARYNYKGNDSNDTENYSRQFTKSNSYTSFQKNDVSSEIRFTF